MPAMTQDLLDECEAIWRLTEERERAAQLQRLEPPLIRFWDGDWNWQAELAAEYSGSVTWVDNDSGPGVFEMPYDHYVGQWIADEHGRMERGEKRNVHVTVDTSNGARWSGRLEDFSVEKREDGSSVVVARFLSDYETLKWYTVWSNPVLPAAIQFPRVFLLAGGSRWCLLTALWLQIYREQTALFAFPDDPLQGSASHSMANWSVVVKPYSFIDDLEDGILWCLLASRWKNWHDIAKPILEDAELSVQWRRYLAATDEPPIPGQTLRNGCLVIDIVDKSGYYIGTANGGTLWDGLIRTVAVWASDFIDSTLDLVEDVDVPQYRIPGLFLTDRRMPYVIYMEGDETGIQSSRYTRRPAKAIQVNCGGHSMPGVNELISATIQLAGDLLASIPYINLPPLGGVADALLRPLYLDTILAWMSVKSVERAENSGWSRYYEKFQDGADRAYTLSSLLVLRAGFWATRTVVSHEVTVNDGSPWIIGDQGKGHFFIGDRIGFCIKGDKTGRVHVDRVKQLTLSWSETEPLTWKPTIGDNSALRDPAQRAMERLEAVLSSLHDLGVFG